MDQARGFSSLCHVRITARNLRSWSLLLPITLLRSNLRVGIQGRRMPTPCKLLAPFKSEILLSWVYCLHACLARKST